MKDTNKEIQEPFEVSHDTFGVRNDTHELLQVSPGRLTLTTLTALNTLITLNTLNTLTALNQS